MTSVAIGEYLPPTHRLLLKLFSRNKSNIPCIVMSASSALYNTEAAGNINLNKDFPFQQCVLVWSFKRHKKVWFSFISKGYHFLQFPISLSGAPLGLVGVGNKPFISTWDYVISRFCQEDAI